MEESMKRLAIFALSILISCALMAIPASASKMNGRKDSHSGGHNRQSSAGEELQEGRPIAECRPGKPVSGLYAQQAPRTAS
jgi:hypothetical protein